jgi:hypothetical protein
MGCIRGGRVDGERHGRDQAHDDELERVVHRLSIMFLIICSCSERQSPANSKLFSMDLEVVTTGGCPHGNDCEHKSIRRVHYYRWWVLRGLRDVFHRGDPQPSEDFVRESHEDICPVVWRDAIRNAPLEALFPMEHIEASPGAWCMALELPDGSFAYGGLRLELAKKDPSIERALREFEKRMREDELMSLESDSKR